MYLVGIHEDTYSREIYKELKGEMRRKLGLLTPLAVRMGLAFSLGTRTRRYCGGTAAMMSTSRGWASSPYFAEVFVFTLREKKVRHLKIR